MVILMNQATNIGINQNQRGLTLVELMVGLAIMGILIAGGYATIRNYMPNEDVRLMAHQIQSSLLMARSEAVKRSADVYMIPSSTGYKDGWIISNNGDRSFADCTDASPESDCIYVFQNNRSVKLTGLTTAKVKYNRQGRIPLTVTDYSIEVCDENESSFVNKRTIQISPNGFPKIITDGSCEP